MCTQPQFNRNPRIWEIEINMTTCYAKKAGDNQLPLRAIMNSRSRLDHSPYSLPKLLSNQSGRSKQAQCKQCSLTTKVRKLTKKKSEIQPQKMKAKIWPSFLTFSKRTPIVREDFVVCLCNTHIKKIFKCCYWCFDQKEPVGCCHIPGNPTVQPLFLSGCRKLSSQAFMMLMKLSNAFFMRFVSLLYCKEAGRYALSFY